MLFYENALVAAKVRVESPEASCKTTNSEKTLFNQTVRASSHIFHYAEH